MSAHTRRRELMDRIRADLADHFKGAVDSLADDHATEQQTTATPAYLMALRDALASVHARLAVIEYGLTELNDKQLSEIDAIRVGSGTVTLRRGSDV